MQSTAWKDSVSEMTYYVSSGMLNSTHSLTVDDSALKYKLVKTPWVSLRQFCLLLQYALSVLTQLSRTEYIVLDDA